MHLEEILCYRKFLVWLFNTKSSLYIYIRYMICQLILLITFLNEHELIVLHQVKWFQLFLYNSHNSMPVICLDTSK